MSGSYDTIEPGDDDGRNEDSRVGGNAYGTFDGCR